MKSLKFLVVFFVFAGLASCSSSDDDGNSNVPEGGDVIVGKWKIQQLMVDEEEVPLSDCEKQSTVEFMTNGNVKTTDFFEDFNPEECVSEIYTEQWEYRGNNIYRISEEGQSYEVTIIFSNNNNAFTISAESEEGSSSVTYVRV